MRPEIFQTASLQTSNPRVNLSPSQAVLRSRQRRQPRRKDIKNGQKEKIDFMSILSSVAQDGEIAFLYAAADASEADNGLGFKRRSFCFSVR